MIGRMLSSTTIRTKIATNADFDDADLTLNTVTKDSHNEMSKAEVKAVLVSLDTLGITDLGNMSVSNETLKQLTNEELDTVLASNYFYQVIDLTLKVELGDDVVPSSLVDATAYNLY